MGTLKAWLPYPKWSGSYTNQSEYRKTQTAELLLEFVALWYLPCGTATSMVLKRYS